MEILKRFKNFVLSKKTLLEQITTQKVIALTLVFIAIHIAFIAYELPYVGSECNIDVPDYSYVLRDIDSSLDGIERNLRN